VSAAEGPGVGDPHTPPDHALGQGVQQQPTQIAAVYLGPGTVALVGFLDVYGAVLVQGPHRLATRQDQLAELLVQPGRPQRDLAVSSWMSSIPPWVRAAGEVSDS
jgi:hypothetical protein